MNANAVVAMAPPSEDDLAMIRQFTAVMMNYRSRLGMIVSGLDAPRSRGKDRINVYGAVFGQDLEAEAAIAQPGAN